MKKELSVLMLAVRSSIYKILVVLIGMSVLQIVFLFGNEAVCYGKIKEIQYQSLEGGISIQTSGMVLDNGCYFSFACYDREEQLLDMEFLHTE